MGEVDENCKIAVIDGENEIFLKLKEKFRDEEPFQVQRLDSISKASKALKNNEFDIYLYCFPFEYAKFRDVIESVDRKKNLSPVVFIKKDDDDSPKEEGEGFLVLKNDVDQLKSTVKYFARHTFLLREYLDKKDIYQNFVEKQPVMFYLIEPTPPYKPKYISPAFESLGYPVEEWLENEDMWLQILHPDDEGWVRQVSRNTMSKGEKVDYEYRVIAKDGSIHWVHDRGGGVSNEIGEVVAWTGVIIDITEKKTAENALKESEERFRDLFENANDLIYTHDLEGNFTSINKTGRLITGYSYKEALTTNISQLIVKEHLEKARQMIQVKLDEPKPTSYEIDILTKNKKRLTLEVNSRMIYKDGVPIGIQGVARDVTERNRLIEERDRFYTLSLDLLATIDYRGLIKQVNPTWNRNLKYEESQLINTQILDLVHPDDKHHALRFMNKVRRGKTVSFEARMLSKDDSCRWISWGVIPIVSENVCYAVGRDITDRKKAEEILEYNANHDTLTKLPNRNRFMKYLEESIKRNKKNSDYKFTVLFLDLDRFKVINDSLGHVIGDKLLVAMAKRLKACLRKGDIVARLGGDEFTILSAIKSENEALKIAERLQVTLSKPFKVENYEVFTSASIGIVIVDENHRTPEDFLRGADSAMYLAKEGGKARYEIFDQKMHARNMSLLRIETDLRHAVENNEFRIYYQPIFKLDSGSIEEFEALIRWEHPSHGLVSPDEFISLAEETGLIVSIGNWILREACQQIKNWQHKFSLPLSISVNFSAKQLVNPNLTKQIGEILENVELPPRFLKMEITETTLMDYNDVALDVIYELKKMGVHLSLDDFGTGYSSLSYLHRFPFNRIKIDRSFISKMETDSKSFAIVKTILILAENLKMDIVSEGIENKEQLATLTELGCNRGQGYFLSIPMNTEETEKFLEKNVTETLLSKNPLLRRNKNTKIIG